MELSSPKLRKTLYFPQKTFSSYFQTFSKLEKTKKKKKKIDSEEISYFFSKKKKTFFLYFRNWSFLAPSLKKLLHFFPK